MLNKYNKKKLHAYIHIRILATSVTAYS